MDYHLNEKAIWMIEREKAEELRENIEREKQGSSEGKKIFYCIFWQNCVDFCVRHLRQVDIDAKRSLLPSEAAQGKNFLFFRVPLPF